MLVSVLSKSFRWLVLVLLQPDSQFGYKLLQKISSRGLFFTVQGSESTIVSFLTLNVIKLGHYHQLSIQIFWRWFNFCTYLFIYFRNPSLSARLPVRPACHDDCLCARLERETVSFILNKDWWHFERFRIPFDYFREQRREDGCGQEGVGFLISFSLCTSCSWTYSNHTHLVFQSLSKLTCQMKTSLLGSEFWYTRVFKREAHLYCVVFTQTL